jgi:hypothetical protein
VLPGVFHTSTRNTSTSSDQCCGTVTVFYGSGSVSDLSYSSGSDSRQVTIPVPDLYLNHKKQVSNKFGEKCISFTQFIVKCDRKLRFLFCYSKKLRYYCYGSATLVLTTHHECYRIDNKGSEFCHSVAAETTSIYKGYCGIVLFLVGYLPPVSCFIIFFTGDEHLLNFHYLSITKGEWRILCVSFL